MFEKLCCPTLIVTFLIIGTLGGSHPTHAVTVHSHHFTADHALSHSSKVKKAQDLMERVTPK